MAGNKCMIFYLQILDKSWLLSKYGEMILQPSVLSF